MKTILDSIEYTFDKVAKTVTFTVAGLPLNFEDVLLVRDLTAKQTIFTGTGTTAGAMVGQVLTLDFDTNLPAFANTDDLQIFINIVPDIDRFFLGGRSLKSVTDQVRVVDDPYLSKIGKGDVASHVPITAQGFRVALPLTEVDISELVAPLIPLPPTGGLPMTVVSTLAADTAEILSTGTLSLTGIAGSLDTLTVNLIPVISSPIPFNNDIDTTYNDIINNINAFTSIPNYTAKKIVTITLTGTAGTADITMGGLTKTATFLTTLAITANTFVSVNRLAYHNVGIHIDSTGIGDIIFMEREDNTFVTGGIVNVIPDLAGTIISKVEIFAARGTGITPNGFVVAATATTLVPITTPMAGGILGGTGIHEVGIEMLLADGSLSHQDIKLNGIIPVPINQGLPIFRINDFTAHDMGIGLAAAGDIVIQDAALIAYKVIKLGEVQDRSCLKTVPLGKVGVVHYWDSGTAIGKETLFQLKANVAQELGALNPLPAGIYNSFDSLVVKDSVIPKKLDMPFKFPALTDIKITGTGVGGVGGTALSVFKYYTENE